MRISMFLRSALILGCLAIAYRATAHAHDDVVPYGFGGKIMTGGHDDVTASNTVNERVFGFDFGETPEDPYSIGDPGFNNGAFGIGIFPNDGKLPSGYTLGFDVVSNLQYWDGSGSVAFSPAPSDVTLGLQKGSFTVDISATGQSGTVPSIGSTGSSGRLHIHLASLLNSVDGTNPNDPNAPIGAYMIGLALKLPGSGLANSDPIYIIYNNGLDEATHDLALDWARDNLLAVPEPSSWILMASAGVGLIATLRRRGGGATQTRVG